MDIIAEILNTDKLAEDRLKAAEEEKRRIIEEASQEEKRFAEEAGNEISIHRDKKRAETDAEINRLTEEINAQCSGQISALDCLYEKNHVKWENEIFESIINIAE